jgi:hypothetical protein
MSSLWGAEEDFCSGCLIFYRISGRFANRTCRKMFATASPAIGGDICLTGCGRALSVRVSFSQKFLGDLADNGLVDCRNIADPEEQTEFTHEALAD